MTGYPVRVTYPSGAVETLTFPTRFIRALFVIGVAGQPVVVTLDDGAVSS